MRVVIQRSKNSSVLVNNKILNEIESGLVLLVCFTDDDTEKDIEYIVKKILALRIFDDENGIMNKSICEVGGKILSISQFTLYAETKNGNRPSYKKAVKKEIAKPLYHKFNEELNKVVETYEGAFGEEMVLNITNDGPITIIIDSKEK